MRSVAISCVRDELDIVEPFVRHTLSYVDRLVLLDNGSTDGTRQLLQRLIDEGLPLEVLDDPSPGHYQWRRMTHLMKAHALRVHEADWIVPLDVDEFLAVDDLADVVRQGGCTDQPIAIPWRTYVPVPEDDPGELNPVVRIRHRLHHEAQQTVKVLIPAQLARQPEVAITQGSHYLEQSGRKLAGRLAENAFLNHFPGRSPAQFARKVAVKHLQYLAMAERGERWGFHYRAAVELLRKDLARLDADFQRTIEFYNLPEGEAFAPELIAAPAFYRGGPLRYTPAEPSKPLVQSLLECAEMIARGHAALSREHQQLTRERRELSTELRQLTETLERREALLEVMHNSWSWRVGRAVTGPVRWMKQCLGLGRPYAVPSAPLLARPVGRAA